MTFFCLASEHSCKATTTLRNLYLGKVFGGLLQVNRCLSIKGAEDQINKPYAFEISTTDSSMYFVADKDKVCVS